MKVAISGKGGVGKTTLAGVMARILARRGKRVLAVDADPDANLASAIGISEKDAASVEPLAHMKEFIEERTSSTRGTYGSFFKLNPKVDDIPERFSLEKDGVRLITVGYVPRGGGGCFCPENALLRSLLSHVLIERDDYVIVDMEAGLEHLSRGTAEQIDALIVVVEPGRRSLHTAREVKRLAGDIGIRHVYVVGNKVVDSADKEFMRENLGDIPVIGFLNWNERIVEADKKGLSPYDVDRSMWTEVDKIIDTIENSAP